MVGRGYENSGGTRTSSSKCIPGVGGKIMDTRSPSDELDPRMAPTVVPEESRYCVICAVVIVYRPAEVISSMSSDARSIFQGSQERTPCEVCVGRRSRGDGAFENRAFLVAMGDRSGAGDVGE